MTKKACVLYKRYLFFNPISLFINMYNSIIIHSKNIMSIRNVYSKWSWSVVILTSTMLTLRDIKTGFAFDVSPEHQKRQGYQKISLEEDLIAIRCRIRHYSGRPQCINTRWIQLNLWCASMGQLDDRKLYQWSTQERKSFTSLQEKE